MDYCNVCYVRRCEWSKAEVNRDGELVHRETVPRYMPKGECVRYRAWPPVKFRMIDFLSDQSLINCVTAVYNAKKVKK